MPASSARFISGVILAAGRSERLGRPKQLVLLGGEPVLRHVIRQALRSRLNEVIVVLGYEAERIAHAVGEMGQKTIINPDYAAGQSTSLRAGLNAVDPLADAVMVLLGDQPGIDSALIDRLIERFQASEARIVRPVYDGHPGNPVVFARSLFPALMTVTGDEGARSLIQRLRHEVSPVPVDGPPPRDLDTEDDYRLLAAEWEE